MSEADKKFQKLGYEKNIDKNNNIVYKNRFEEFIVFDVKYMNFWKKSKNGSYAPITIKEFLVIDLKCKELRWIK